MSVFWLYTVISHQSWNSHFVADLQRTYSEFEVSARVKEQD